MTPRLPAACVIAVLGAAGTGKTALAQAIAGRLQQRGIAAAAVGDFFNEWCELEGRTPRPGDLAAIATGQTRRIAQAAAQGVAVADTTALMTAVHGDLLFHEDMHYEDALAVQRGYAITLITALDFPGGPNDLQRGQPPWRAQVDAALRAALARGGVPFSVVHGTGPERLSHAWDAINSIAARAETAGEADRSDTQGGWVWPCDKCSDPACEHRLFSGLLGRKRRALP